MMSEKSEFEQEAERGTQSSAGEVWHFVFNNKKWWLTPIIVALLLLSVLVVLGGTGAAPFIYTLF